MLYRFNLITDDDPIYDREGIELPDLQTAIFRALRIARKIIADKHKDDRITLGWSIEIADETGSLVGKMPFAATVVIH